ncbi:MAG: BatA domain-containing protein [Planctomycetota bacterium]
MSFLNIMLLGGAAAFLAPLVIHLLNRTRFQSVDWGAMHLLESAMQVNSRRMQWESLLLLLIRCLIPILLAVCLARPVLTAMQLAGLQDRKAIVVLVDDSLSMGQVTEDSGSLMDLAITEILALAGENKKAEKSIVLTSGSSSSIEGSTVDPVRFARAIQNLKPSSGYSDPQQAIASALGRLGEMTSSNKHLILISDFRAGDWQGRSREDWTRLAEQLQSASPPIQLTLLPVGETGANAAANDSIGNSSVRFVAPEDYATSPNIPKRIEVVVEQFGKASNEALEVFFEVDGRRVASERVQLEDNGSEQLGFVCEFKKPGWHSVSVTVDDRQGIPGDDRASMVVQAREAMRVLRVRAGARRDVDFLRLALMPFQDDRALNTFQLEDCAVGAVQNKLREAPAVVVLDDVKNLPDRGLESLTSFVREGGGLVLFTGNNVDAKWYQKAWPEGEFLPAQFAEERKELDDSASMGLMRETLQTAGMSVFNGTEAGDLYEMQFQSWLPLLENEVVKKGDEPDQPNEPEAAETAKTAEDAGESFTVLRFSDGSPCIQIRRVGAGTVVQCAFSLRAESSNLPQKPVFVPLMQNLIWMAAESSQAPNVPAGSNLALHHASEAGGYFQHSDSDLQVAWGTAAGDGTGIDEQTQRGQSLLSPRAPGLYKQVVQEQQELAMPLFAIQAARSESQLAPLPEAELESIATTLDATVAESAQDYSESAQLRQNGREIWRWFLIGLLALLFGEILLGRSITKGTI